MPFVGFTTAEEILSVTLFGDIITGNEIVMLVTLSAFITDKPKQPKNEFDDLKKPHITSRCVLVNVRDNEKL